MRGAARWGALCALSFLASIGACGGEPEAERADPAAALPVESLAETLATAAGPDGYRVDSAPSPGGRISGTVRYDGEVPDDTLTRPTHDLTACRPQLDAPVQGSADGVGDVVVWLTGVTHGAAERASLRVALTLSDCALSPRVQRAPAGATLMVRSDDDMDARLRFLSASASTGSDSARYATGETPRAIMQLAASVSVVPNTEVLASPGLVEVRDDRHPWIRGWIAVAPHPYVAVTDESGRFAFPAVPAGTYVLVAWHERLGRVALSVLVDVGVDTRVTVTLREQ